MPSAKKTRLRKVIRPVGPSIAYVRLTKRQYALIDSEDAERIGAFNWHAHWEPRPGCYYGRRKEKREDGSYGPLRLHVAIMGRVDGMVVDHINGRSLDNRKCNLRHATTLENNCNRRTSRANKLGVKGVRAVRNRFQATITVGGKRVYLGRFGSAAEASEAYDSAAKRFFGDFARAA